MLTCEAVLAEASYLTRSLPGARVALMEMIGEGFLSIGMAVADHHSALLAMVPPLWQRADVAGRCLPRASGRTPPAKSGTHPGQRFSRIPKKWAAGH